MPRALTDVSFNSHSYSVNQDCYPYFTENETEAQKGQVHLCNITCGKAELGCEPGLCVRSVHGDPYRSVASLASTSTP